jgi:glycosyltransferase involved in cell wall biosynthesis
MNNKLVTVIIPTYNCAKTLDRAIKSILIQTYIKIELLIINDKSTDNTKDILKKYKDNTKIRIINNNRNYGKFISVNIGIDNSSGSYITLLDADDMFHEDKIRHQATVFKLYDTCIACLHNIIIYDNFNKIIKNRNNAEISIMFKKKEILDTIGYYHPNRFGADTEFKDRLYNYFDKTRILTVNKVLYFAISRQNSLTTNTITGKNSIPRKIYEYNYKNWHNRKKNLYVNFPLINKLF